MVADRAYGSMYEQAIIAMNAVIGYISLTSHAVCLYIGNRLSGLDYCSNFAHNIRTANAVSG